jgi:hypothetical protein
MPERLFSHYVLLTVSFLGVKMFENSSLCGQSENYFFFLLEEDVYTMGEMTGHQKLELPP